MHSGGHLVAVNALTYYANEGISGCLDIVCKYPTKANIQQKIMIGGFHCLVECGWMWEKVKRCFSVEDSDFKDMETRLMARNLYVTHLIGSVYLRGSPSSVLHIVLLHLGTNFWTGSNVTCRLVEKRGKKGGGGEKKQRREQGKGCSYIKTW